jgi:Flp pilus assembly protein TadG
MRQTSCGPRRGARRAAAAVEFALILPLLVLLLVGLFELSRGMMVKQTLSAAARKGCRTGIIHQYGNQDITTDATNILRDNNFDSSKFNPPSVGSITITVTGPNGQSLKDALDAPSGSTVSVQVAIPASSVKWFSAYFLTDSMVVSDKVVMMKQ